MSPHNAALELETLQEELTYMQKKLSSCGKEAKRIISQCIKQIERDILRNTAIVEDDAC